jgi:hypothetical protein
VPNFEGLLPKKKKKKKKKKELWPHLDGDRTLGENRARAKEKRKENADPLEVSWAIPLLDEKENVNYWFRSNERNSCREGLEFVI